METVRLRSRRREDLRVSVTIRLTIAVACALALVAGGVALERHGPVPVSAGSLQDPTSGAWSCPHGGGEGWRVWITVTNPGSTPVEVRVTTAAGGAASPPSASVVEPSTLRYIEVAAPLAGSATVVEYLGGLVAAGTVVLPPEGGLAAEPCVGSPGSVWHLAEASTLRGEIANLVVHNPFATQAVVDVILTAGARQIRPGRLQGVVLGPLEARAFELNHYALGEAALSATVLAVQGRVAVASVIVSAEGVRSSIGLAEPATRWLLPGVGAQTEIVVRGLPDQDAPVSAEFHSAEGTVPALDLEAVSAGTAESFGFQTIEGGLLVQSDGPSPMIAGRRMILEAEAPPPAPSDDDEGRRAGGGGGADKGGGDAKRGQTKRGGSKGGSKGGDREKEKEPPPEPPAADQAATSGAAETAARWLVPPSTLPEGQPSVLLLQNPGDLEVTASVTFLSQSGSTGPPTSVPVPPGSTARIPIAGGPLAALVEGEGLVAAQATLVRESFAVVLGVPV